MTSNDEIYLSYLCDQIMAACNRINKKLDVMDEQQRLFTYTDSYAAPAYVAAPYFHNQPLSASLNTYQPPPPPPPPPPNICQQEYQPFRQIPPPQRHRCSVAPLLAAAAPPPPTPPPQQPSYSATTKLPAVPPPPAAISPPCNPNINEIGVNELVNKWNLDGSLDVSVVISGVVDVGESESKDEGQVINIKKPKSSTMADDRFLLYTVTLRTEDIYSLELYEPQFADLIVLSDITSKCVTDLDRRNSPFTLDLLVPVAKLCEGRSSLVLWPFDPGGMSHKGSVRLRCLFWFPP